MEERKSRGSVIKPRDISIFCSQIAMMLNSGMLVRDGIEALAQSHRNDKMAEIYAALSERVAADGSLKEALLADECWPKYLAEMVGVGECTGRLEEVMEKLSAYYGREHRLHSAVINAVSYPLVLGVMMLLILFIMLWKVLPLLCRVLNNFGITLSSAGGGMVRVGVNIGYVALVVLAIVLVVVLVAVALLKTGARSGVQKLIYKLFAGARRIGGQMMASRITGVLSMMLSSGYMLDRALETLPAVLENETAAASIYNVRRKVADGISFEDAFAEAGIIDSVYLGMFRMGCATGREDAVMAKISDEYEAQTEESIERVVAVIEPTMVVVLSLVIGIVLLSIMLPMAGMISSIL